MALHFRVALLSALSIALAGACTVSLAQEARPPAKQQAPEQKGSGPRPAPRSETRENQPLPPDSKSEHSITVGGRTLQFTVTAGSLRVTNPNGRETADIVFTAYTVAGTPPQRRPVTFVFNGGPGSASTWLQIGAVGPWRLPLNPEAISPSAPPELQTNTETWLDFTDLVFIDPAGTGYSRIVENSQVGEETKSGQGQGNTRGGANRYFYSVSGDAESIAEFIQNWLGKFDRLSSPKMILGESYAGIRAPKVTQALQTRYGVGISAVVMASPVIDFDGRRGDGPFLFAQLLPSLGASHLEHIGQVPSREALQETESYARGEYLTDLLRGPRNDAALGRISERVANITGLNVETVRRLGGRINSSAYIREVYRPEGKVASSYDSSVTAFDPNPYAETTRFDDPFSTGLLAPMTSAMVNLYTNTLDWHVDRRYHMLSYEVNRSWQWGNSTSAPESVSDLKSALALDSRLRVLVVHGFTDLVAPYLASVLLLDQLPPFGDASRVALKIYPGGHMFYARDNSRKAFHADGEALATQILQVQAN